MSAIVNLIHREVERARQNIASTRIGEITLYDNKKYLVKVKIIPEGYETGWIPLATPYAGDGFGLLVGPCIGDQVVVDYQEGDYQTGICSARLFNEVDVAPNPGPECGEVFLIHKSGTYLQFKDNGDILIHCEGKITSDADEWEHTGDVRINGDLDVQGEVNDSTRTMSGDRSIYNSHSHPGDSGGTTGAPNQQQ